MPCAAFPLLRSVHGRVVDSAENGLLRKEAVGSLRPPATMMLFMKPGTLLCSPASVPPLPRGTWCSARAAVQSIPGGCWQGSGPAPVE